MQECILVLLANVLIILILAFCFIRNIDIRHLLFFGTRACMFDILKKVLALFAYFFWQRIHLYATCLSPPLPLSPSLTHYPLYPPLTVTSPFPPLTLPSPTLSPSPSLVSLLLLLSPLNPSAYPPLTIPLHLNPFPYPFLLSPLTLPLPLLSFPLPPSLSPFPP